MAAQQSPRDGTPPITIAVLAHNEERRIATCLRSLPLDDPEVAIHVIVNGSRDATAAIARGFEQAHSNVTVHDWIEGGKSRSWNRFVHDVLDSPDGGGVSPVHVFVDGDAEIAPGSIMAMAKMLAANTTVTAVAGMPMNGRRAAQYRAEIHASHGLFGDLYALSGLLVQKMRARNIRLPEDLVGDDSLVGAIAKTNGESEDDWQPGRCVACDDAGFYCEPNTFVSPASLGSQYRRMVSYSRRHFQNIMVSDIMRRTGPAGLPRNLAQIYDQYLPGMQPRGGVRWWFDRKALAAMRREVAP